MNTDALNEIDFKSIKLPFQPHVLNAILRLKDDSMMNFHDLNNLIKSDQNLTSLILKIANSSFYFRGNPVTTPEQAIGMVGFKTVISFAMAASVKNAFDSANYTRFRKYVWQHSIVTGIISKNIACHLGHEDKKEEAFIAGVLHDIGKVILNNLDRKKFISVIHEATENNVSFSESEKKHFGFDHTQIGYRCIENWKLPDIYKTVAGYHMHCGDQPDIDFSEDEKILLPIICYANILAKKYGYGAIIEEDKKREAYLLSHLKLSEEDQNYYNDQFLEKMKQDSFYQFFITFI